MRIRFLLEEVEWGWFDLVVCSWLGLICFFFIFLFFLSLFTCLALSLLSPPLKDPRHRPSQALDIINHQLPAQSQRTGRRGKTESQRAKESIPRGRPAPKAPKIAISMIMRAIAVLPVRSRRYHCSSGIASLFTCDAPLPPAAHLVPAPGFTHLSDIPTASSCGCICLRQDAYCSTAMPLPARPCTWGRRRSPWSRCLANAGPELAWSEIEI
jgi:hypothetical protein